MKRFVARVSILLLCLALFLGVLVWLTLYSPFFSNMRRVAAENFLTEQIGQPLYVRDDVRVVPGRISRLHVSGVEIPSEGISDTLLAKLKFLELDLDLFAILSGRVGLDNLIVDGLQVNLLTQADGTTSWNENDNLNDALHRAENSTGSTTVNATKKTGTTDGILAFLDGMTTAFTAVGLTIDNKQTGFSFLFDLKNLNLDQLDQGTRVTLRSEGSVNGQKFEINGNYPRGADYTTEMVFGGVKASFKGSPVSLEQGGGFIGNFELDTGEIGDFLEVLKLNRAFEGHGNLTAKLTSQRDTLKVTDLEAVLDVSDGKQFEAEGTVDNLYNATGFDLAFDGRFHPKGQPAKVADKLKDLKLDYASAHIVSDANGFEFEDIIVTTNAFKQGLGKIGPISVGHAQRTEDGYLALENILLKAGPKDAPYVSAKGNIQDALDFKQVDFEGSLLLPASVILEKLSDEVGDTFGAVKATFKVDDADGTLGLNRIVATTVDTDIWALDWHAKIGDIHQLGELDTNIDLDIEDGAQFLRALKLKAVETGPLKLTASLQGKLGDFSTGLGMTAGKSRLAVKLDTTAVEGRKKVRGRIHSKQLAINDLKNAIAAVNELTKIRETSKNNSATGTSNTLEVQPLVLPKDEDVSEDKTDAPDAPEVQPLVLPKNEIKPNDEADAPARPEVQPLVLAREEGRPVDLFNLKSLLRETDVQIAIDIEKITGEKGVSSMSSELVANSGKMSLGPVEVNYGGGFFKLDAKMDLIKTPQLLSVSGGTGGWDFGEILDFFGLGIKASGTLHASFALTGNRSSIKNYINSMYGSSSIAMSQGLIGTNLLDLAGLGVFPWLFSGASQKGYSRIACVSAPIKINAGNVSFEAAVAETDRVQVVAGGALNWRSNSIAVNAQARPLGKPLSRSAWPVNVSGTLSKPNVKLVVGGTREKRADGASEMPKNRKPCVRDIYQLK